MRIGSEERLVTSISLGAIVIIGATIWWTYSEVDYANDQRRATSDIARGLAELSLVSVEYRLHRNERARVQWDAVSKRVDRLVADARFRDRKQMEILADLRARRTVGQRLFAAITAQNDEKGTGLEPNDANRRFDALLLSQLLTNHHEDLTDAFRLNSLAADRIILAQRRMMIVILAGLALVASIIAGASWFLRRGVLDPIARLGVATHQVAAGNWNFVIDVRRADEIGELSKNFNAMTQSLRDSFAKVERSNHDLAMLNQELETFSYSVSHDLRGPLRSMDGFSLMLMEDYGDRLDEEGKDALQRIRAASQKMGHLIDDLLRLSGVTRAELNVKRIDLSEIAHEIAASLEADQPGREMEWAIERGLSVRADPALMRIAMQNLIQNAWKFTGRTERPLIRVGALKRDAGRVYFVADNGAGFDMSYADKLFAPFQRLHHAGDFAGTGIGLAIVHQIIRRHDGEIRAEAKEGGGATFFFTIAETKGGSDEQDNPAG